MPIWAGLIAVAIFSVLLGALVFALQGRATLQDRYVTVAADATVAAAVQATSEQRQAEQQAEIRNGAATVDVLTAALGDAVAEQAVLEAENAALGLSLDETAGALATLEAQPTATPQPIAPPAVRFIVPTDDRTVAPGSELRLVVVAADNRGVASLTLTRDGEAVAKETAVQARLLAIDETFDFPEEGVFEFTASAIGWSGDAAEPVSIVITVVDVEARNVRLRAEVEREIQQLRDIEPLAPVEPTVLTRAELRERVEAEFAEEYSPAEAADDVLVYAAFGFLAPGFDLYTTIVDLFGDAVTGRYYPETDEFIVISDDDVLDVLELWTHGHEYVHALQDQLYDLTQLSDPDLDSEARAALRAFAEGEAEWTQIQYVLEGYFTPGEREALFELLTAESNDAIFADVPPILLNELAFPYAAGTAFVEAIFADGGWPAVDAVWSNLPRSTEHILHVDRYLAGDMPQVVSVAPLTGTLPAAWRWVDEDSLGEFYLREHLSLALPAADVDLAATGWGGDAYAVYTDDAGGIVLTWRQVWDSADDAEEFLTAYRAYGAELWSAADPLAAEADSACWASADAVVCLVPETDSQTFIIRAPDRALLDSALAANR